MPAKTNQVSRVTFQTFQPNTLLALLIAATIAKAVTEYGAIAASAFLGQSVVRNLRNDVFDKILHQPLRFFDRNPTGELMSRISADIERVQSAASDTLAEALKQGAIAVFMVGTILYHRLEIVTGIVCSRFRLFCIPRRGSANACVR